jgi:hypothetical protein
VVTAHGPDRAHQMHRAGARTAAHRLPWLPLDPGANRPVGSVPQIQLGETPERHYGSRMTGPCFVADVMGAGLAVTVRADPVLVRADSSSPWDRVPSSSNWLERHSAFVRAARFQSHPFDILCLPQNPVCPALGAM